MKIEYAPPRTRQEEQTMRKLPGVKITVHPNRKYKVQKVKMKRNAISLLSVAIYFLFAKSQPQKDLKVDNFKKKAAKGIY